MPTKVASNPSDSMVAVGFKSGFIRVFDLLSNKLTFETLIFDSPVMDLAFSPSNKFLAVFFKSSRIVIFNLEKGIQPVKTIDYDMPNSNYFSLAFS
jgi:WD40 repeat protein